MDNNDRATTGRAKYGFSRLMRIVENGGRFQRTFYLFIIQITVAGKKNTNSHLVIRKRFEDIGAPYSLIIDIPTAKDNS